MVKKLYSLTLSTSPEHVWLGCNVLNSSSVSLKTDDNQQHIEGMYTNLYTKAINKASWHGLEFDAILVFFSKQHWLLHKRGNSLPSCCIAPHSFNWTSLSTHLARTKIFHRLFGFFSVSPLLKFQAARNRGRGNTTPWRTDSTENSPFNRTSLKRLHTSKRTWKYSHMDSLYHLFLHCSFSNCSSRSTRRKVSHSGCIPKTLATCQSASLKESNAALPMHSRALGSLLMPQQPSKVPTSL